MFLVDTGAEISLLKVAKLIGSTPMDDKNICTLTGISDTGINTLGSVNANIQINDSQLIHEFQLITDDIAIPTDGILGRDFLTKYHCNIDYDTWLLSGTVGSEKFEFEIIDNLEGNIYVPPRCEAFRKINLPDVKSVYLIKSHQTERGVFVANSIVDKNFPYVKILNTTNKTVKVDKNLTETITNIDNYEVYNFYQEIKNKRNKKLLKSLKLDRVPTKAKNKLIELCQKYNDIFSLENDHLTTNNFYKQTINLEDPRPVYIKNYRTPESQLQETNKQVRKMLDDGIVRHSTSHYNSPIMLVPKKSNQDEKKWRLVVDFRQLNKKILGDKFPLPRIDEILDHLGRAKYFTTLDLMSGFHQIELEEDSKKFTAFSSSNGHYEFNRLPFGLNISPNSFQRMMTIALSGLPPECAFLYIDDIIVVGCSINHHISNLENVFSKLRHFNLKLNPAKCNFFGTDVTYLGHHVSEQGIQPDKTKFEAIEKYPRPENADDVRRFVAFANYYRRFLPQFAKIANPLNRLLRKNQPFIWSDICENAFQEIKTKLLSPEILQFPDFEKTFILTTDASKVACGAILSQGHGDIDLPVCYASRTFTKGESNKSTIEQELVAIHWAINHFRPYLYGRKFIVRTDHRPLVYLFSMKEPSSKLTRMRLDLEEFDFSVHYVPGKSNVGADALSRVVIDIEDLKQMYVLLVQTRARTKQQMQQSNQSTKVDEPDQLEIKIYETININDVFSLPKLEIVGIDDAQTGIKVSIKDKRNRRELTPALIIPMPLSDTNDNLSKIVQNIVEQANKLKIDKLALALTAEFSSLCDIHKFIESFKRNSKKLSLVLFKTRKTIHDEDEIHRIIQYYHDSSIGGHVGANRLWKKLKAYFHWKGMLSTIKKYVKKCIQCKLNKQSTKTNEQITETTTPRTVFDSVAIDTIGPLTKSQNNNRYALTLQCDLSKYVIIVPIPDKQAQTLAKAFVESLILVFGCPKSIRSDLGTEYKNELFDKIAKFLQLEQKFSTAYHPQTIGGLERNHRCLNEYLRAFSNELHDDWDSWIPYYTFCYNTTPNTETQYTPFEIVYGKQVTFPTHIVNSQIADPVYNHDEYYSNLKYRLQTIAKRVKDAIIKTKKKRIQVQKNVHPIDINVNDQILLKSETNKKLDHIYEGPFTVLGVEHPNLTILYTPTNQEKTVHKNRIIKFNN